MLRSGCVITKITREWIVSVDPFDKVLQLITTNETIKQVRW